MQDRWWEQKAEEVQRYADTNNFKILYVQRYQSHLRPFQKRNAPLPMSVDDSTIFRDKEGSRRGWQEHFNQLPNRTSTVDQEVLQQIPQKPLLEDLDMSPGVDEAETAIKDMNCGTAPGADRIPAELYKALDTTAFNAFHDILVSLWKEEGMPADFRDPHHHHNYALQEQKEPNQTVEATWHFPALHCWINSGLHPPQQNYHQRLGEQLTGNPVLGSALAVVPYGYIGCLL